MPSPTRAESISRGSEGLPSGEALPVLADCPAAAPIARTQVLDDEAQRCDAWHASFGTSLSRALATQVSAACDGEDSTYGTARAVRESIIASDDRVQVGATDEPPFAWICDLSIIAANGSLWLGTGWLAAPRLVITAGHCVYLHNAGGWIAGVRVSPGRNAADTDPHFDSARVMSVSGWVHDRQPHWDYGAIVLPEAAATLGWFGYAARNDTALDGNLVNVVGYPSDKPTGSMWGNVHRLSTPSFDQLLYLNDTYGGMSGAPVIDWNGSDYSVLGIHNYGDLSGNRATRITRDVFFNIRAWAAEVESA